MFEFKNILCPVDFSDYSYLAARYAASLAAKYGARLTFFHSVSSDVERDARDYENAGIAVATARSTAVKRLEQLLAKSIPGVHTSTKFGSGRPFETILDVAESDKVDLIVMGTHGRVGYERLYIGSVTNQVLHKSKIPVLTVSRSLTKVAPDPGVPIDIEKILCAVDISTDNGKLVDLAVSVARKFESKLIFYTVTQVDEEEDWLQVQKVKTERMKRLLNVPDGIRAEFLVEGGHPGEEIVRAIHRNQIDMVVMGHHTEKPLDYWFLGSVASRVIAESSCPVFVLRQ